jgi:hypothetical protein
LTIHKATLESRVTAIMGGFNNNERGQGQCEILKDKPGKRKK